MAFVLNFEGVSEILRSEGMKQVTAAAAEAVADNTRAQNIQVEGSPGSVELPVEVKMRITDRAHGTVTLAHPAGLAVQAKYGALTKAAAQAGLDVHERNTK